MNPPTLKSAEASLTILVETLPLNDLPELAGLLAIANARLFQRLSTRPLPPPPETTTLLSVQEAAARLGMTPQWLYRHSASLPFARKLGHRTLRFDAAGIDRWLKHRTVPTR
jgi:predicted DNA-binding transcriptional regulator AlpA